MSDTPSGLKPVTIEAMFNTMTGNDPNQKWKLDERTGELVEDNEAGGDGIALTSTSHTISEDALETVEIEIDDKFVIRPTDAQFAKAKEVLDQFEDGFFRNLIGADSIVLACLVLMLNKDKILNSRD